MKPKTLYEIFNNIKKPNDQMLQVRIDKDLFEKVRDQLKRDGYTWRGIIEPVLEAYLKEKQEVEK